MKTPNKPRVRTVGFSVTGEEEPESPQHASSPPAGSLNLKPVIIPRAFPEVRPPPPLAPSPR